MVHGRDISDPRSATHRWLAILVLVLIQGLGVGTVATAAAAERAVLRVDGSARTPSGQPIGGLTVELVRPGSTDRFETTTAEDGTFTLVGLPDGVYEPVVQLDPERFERMEQQLVRQEHSEGPSLAVTLTLIPREPAAGAVVLGGLAATLGAGISLPVLLSQDESRATAPSAPGNGAEVRDATEDETPPSFLPPQHPEPQQPNPDRPPRPPIFNPPPNASPTR